MFKRVLGSVVEAASATVHSLLGRNGGPEVHLPENHDPTSQLQLLLLLPCTLSASAMIVLNLLFHIIQHHSSPPDMPGLGYDSDYSSDDDSNAYLSAPFARQPNVLVDAFPHRWRDSLREATLRSHQITATLTTTLSSPLWTAHTPFPATNLFTRTLRFLELQVRLDAGPFARIPLNCAMFSLHPTSAGNSGLAAPLLLLQCILTLPSAPCLRRSCASHRASVFP